jgi:hypothetical protein
MFGHIGEQDAGVRDIFAIVLRVTATIGRGSAGAHVRRAIPTLGKPPRFHVLHPLVFQGDNSAPAINDKVLMS